MAIIITDECINCGACEPECPNNAIYEGGMEWAMSEGNTLQGFYQLASGESLDVHKKTPLYPTIIILLYLINVQSVLDFMKNLSALLFVL